MNADDRWKPVEQEQKIKSFSAESNEDQKQVKMKFRSMDEVIQVSNVPKHKTYHVPPGELSKTTVHRTTSFSALSYT